MPKASAYCLALGRNADFQFNCLDLSIDLSKVSWLHTRELQNPFNCPNSSSFEFLL